MASISPMDSSIDNSRPIVDNSSVRQKCQKLFIILIVLYVIIRPFIAIVDDGHVGVQRDFGEINLEKYLPEGPYFSVPVALSISPVNIRLELIKSTSSATTKELYATEIESSLLYSLDGQKVAEMCEYLHSRENLEQEVILPGLAHGIKTVTALYDCEDLVLNRLEVKQKMKEAVSQFISSTCKALSQNLESLVIVDNFIIDNINFSQEYINTIEEKVSVEQAALREVHYANKIAIESQAQAQVIQLRAEAEAYALNLIQEAHAKAIQKESDALKTSEELADSVNEALINFKRLEKWSGSLPDVITEIVKFDGNMTKLSLGS